MVSFIYQTWNLISYRWLKPWLSTRGGGGHGGLQKSHHAPTPLQLQLPAYYMLGVVPVILHALMHLKTLYTT